MTATGTKVIFWGATGQARVLRECMKHQGTSLVALFDNNVHAKSPFEDVPIYHGPSGFDVWLRSVADRQSIEFLIAIGGDRGRDRVDLQDRLEAAGLRAATARHPSAFIADSASLAGGTQVLAHAAICVDAVLGKGVIVNTGASVDHECILEDGVHVCPGARVAGCVRLERFVTIGTGAVVLPRVRIGEGAIIGAGAVVLRDVLPRQVVVGNPARLLRSVE